MEKLFKGLIGVGVIGACVAFGGGVVLGSDVLFEFALAFCVIVAACGSLGLIGLRAMAQLGRPEVEQAVQQASRHAAETGAQVTKVGVTTGRRLIPSIQYLFTFSGRVTRKEYWIAQIVTGVVTIIAVLWITIDASYLMPWLLLLITAVVLVAFGVRRTRDTGVNQWWFLLALVAPVNLALVVFLLLVPTDEFLDSKF